jgi:hypothetical protein
MPDTKFKPGDPRIHRTGRPKKKTFHDILQDMGAVIKDKDGKEIDRLDGDERLLKEIVDAAIREKNPAMMKFIYQHMNAPQADPETLEIKKRTETARAQKLEIANQKARGELISRDLVRRVFGQVYAVDRSIFLAIGPTTAAEIAAEAKIKDDALVLKIEDVITKSIYQGLSAAKRAINDFLTSGGGEPIRDDIPEPKPKKRTKKAAAP